MNVEMNGKDQVKVPRRGIAFPGVTWRILLLHLHFSAPMSLAKDRRPAFI